MILIPGIFPRFYGAPEVRKGQISEIRPTDVEIPVHVFDGLRAPAAFLSRYFEVDREVSKQISGWALRLRGDMIADPASAARLWAEALVVAARYLFLVDPEAEMARLATLFRNYCAAIRTNAERTASTYGVGKGSSLQINTPGVYVDSLRGRCTACSDHDEAGRYVEVMTGLEELRRLKKANELDDQEILRRQKRLDDDLLDPFEPAATP
jgi:hypothetical protein